MKNEEEFIYDVKVIANYILDNIPDALYDKLGYSDIIILLRLEEDFFAEELEFNKKNKPHIAPELLISDGDELYKYIVKNAVKNNIILSVEEIQEILDWEFIYLEDNGQAGDVFSLN